VAWQRRVLEETQPDEPIGGDEMRLTNRHRNQRRRAPRIAISQGEITADLHYPATMRALAVEIDEGRVVFEGTPGEEHYNATGVVHGGWAATLLDSALGCAVHSTLPAGTGYTSLSLEVKFVRPITRDSGAVRCVAEVLHRGRRQATAEARVTDASGRLVAHGTSTCMILS
jgi:uncharacterized protein (TIGR00369 family)